MGIIGALIAVIVLVIALIVFVLSRVVTVPASRALIISGAKQDGETKVVRQGGRTFVVPILQSAQEISLSQKKIQLTVDSVDANSVEVQVEAVAIIKVGSSESDIRAAAERFLESGQDIDSTIVRNIQEVLLGSLRSIVAKMTVNDLIKNRENLQQKVLETVKTDLSSMGLETESLQVQRIEDKNGYIKALGVPETERVFRDARIAKAQKDQEANTKEVESRKIIAENNRDLAIRQSELQAEIEARNAETAASGPLEKAKQDRQIAELDRATAIANADLRDKELDTEVRKPADAEKYSRTQAAEAAKIEAVRQAEAQAETVRLSSIAEAEATRITGQAQADAVRAQGLAEAETMNKKAAAFKNYNNAAVVQLLVDKLPEIVRNAAEPITNIKDLSVISTEGASAIPRMIANNFGQVDEILKKTVGVSVSGLLDSIGQNGQKDSVPFIETDAQTVTVPEPTAEKSDDEDGSRPVTPKDVSRATRKSRTNNVK